MVLLGFSLRWAGLEWGQAYSYFGQGDAILAYAAAVNYGQGQERACYLGQPSYNLHSKLPGPLWTLFCFASLRFHGSIEGTLLAIILLNTASVYLVYLLAERTVGPPGAKWAALFAATAPWLIYYSVGVYNPDVMLFLGSVLFLALWDTTQRDGSRNVFWVGLVLLAMLQFHMSGLMLIPAVVVVLALSPARLNWPLLIAGWLAGGCLYLPYLHGEMAHNWQNTRGMMSGPGGYSWDGLKAITAPLNFLVSWAPRWTRSAAEYREMGRACFGSFGLFLTVNILSAVVAAFLVIGAFGQIRSALRGGWRSPRQAFKRTPGILFLAILLLVPPGFAAVSGKSFHSRHCLVLVPALLCLVGGAAARWLSDPRLGRYFAAALVVTTCANIWFMPAMYRYEGRRIEQGEVFVPSFRQLETVYQQLKLHAGAGHRVVVSDGNYLASLTPSDAARQDAEQISRYVVIREKEAALLSGPQPAEVVYTLHRAEQASAENPAVAYRAHGIALIATPVAP